MRLRDLLNSISDAHWDQRFAGLSVSGISCDSREDQPGLFVAVSGAKFNGADFIRDAIDRGAIAVALAAKPRGFRIPDDIAVIETPDPKRFLRQVTERFYGNPSSLLKTVGITGTNGKTTITYLLESIIRADRKQCAVIGTVNYRIGDQVVQSKNTTPGYLENQRALWQLTLMDVPFCVMEVSSHALEQGRVDGIGFAAAVFTNLTQDHLDFHEDMEQYFQAKALLFKGLSAGAAAVINTDDEYGRRMKALSRGPVTTYGIDAQAQVMARNIRYDLEGSTFDIVLGEDTLPVRTKLIGKHNVYNILAAAACAQALGFSPVIIRKGIEAVKHVPGRLEPVGGAQGFSVFIDYAHTEDGLVNVLKSLREVGKGRIIVVFGCGGDRDRDKRPKMGRAVCGLADHAIVTSDNPRSEDPQAIINAITAGFTKNNFEVCPDRQEAIGRALGAARGGDIVLLAGKGHEDYQILKDKTIPFNEREIVEKFLSVHR